MELNQFLVTGGWWLPSAFIRAWDRLDTIHKASKLLYCSMYIQAALEPVYFGVYRIDKFIQRTKNEPIQRTK